jgi:acylphosphatase
MLVGVHIGIQGLVQGVGYRYFVYRHASRLGLAGWVRNAYNGDVELEVEGERSLIEELIKELKVGPRSAHVKDLRIEWQDYQSRHKDFEIR